MPLAQVVREALVRWSTIATLPHLKLLDPVLLEIETAAKSDKTLENYCIDLEALASMPDFPVAPELLRDFIQKFGEAHFYCMCSARGVTLERVPERADLKTPDFRSSRFPRLTFEVKTLSVVDDGKSGLFRALDSSVEANISMESQRREGRRVAVGESETSPLGAKAPLEERRRRISELLVRKVVGNFKDGQFPQPDSYLVVNLVLLSEAIGDRRELRPVYPDNLLFSTSITGVLWMMAFARDGMLVLDHPEFEGRPCVQGLSAVTGILADQPYNAIKGILVMVYPLGSTPWLGGLFRNADDSEHDAFSEEVREEVLRLVDERWNDGLDTNGYRLD